MESLRPHRPYPVVPALRGAARGFTLIEMMVVLTIIIVITGVVLSSQSSFNKTLILANTAYDLALTIRSAETYGIASQVSEGITNAGYGLDFQAASDDTFTFFADSYPSPSASAPCHPSPDPSAPDAKPGNCAYDEGSDAIVSVYTLGNGVTFSDFCAYAAGGWECKNSNGGSLSTLDIVFVRPNAEPFMTANGNYSASTPVTQSCLALTSPQGGARYVSVSASGAINANAESCP